MRFKGDDVNDDYDDDESHTVQGNISYDIWILVPQIEMCISYRI